MGKVIFRSFRFLFIIFLNREVVFGGGVVFRFFDFFFVFVVLGLVCVGFRGVLGRLVGFLYLFFC